MLFPICHWSGGVSLLLAGSYQFSQIACYWKNITSAQTLSVPVGVTLSGCTGVAGNGTCITGFYTDPISLFQVGCFWDASYTRTDIPPTGGGFYSIVNATNQDGTVLVGEIQIGPGITRAFRWTVAGGVQNLGTIGGIATSQSFATSVSADGSIVVGYNITNTGSMRAFRWTQATGMLDLTAGVAEMQATGISADGTTVVGRHDAYGAGVAYDAFVWTAAGGVVNLSTLGAAPGVDVASASAVNANGTLVVGRAKDALGNSYAVSWLNAAFPTKLITTKNTVADAVTSDGTYICINAGTVGAWLWHNGVIQSITGPVAGATKAYGITKL